MPVSWKARFLLLWNSLALATALFYLLLWSSLSLGALRASLASEQFYLLLTLLVALIMALLATIVASLLLKLRILREVRDSGLKPIREIYCGASRLNLSAYIVFYPLMFSLLSHSRRFLTIPLEVFIVIALVAAVPLLVLAGRGAGDYRAVKTRLHLGRHTCPRCAVSLAYPPTRRWTCYRCGGIFT